MTVMVIKTPYQNQGNEDEDEHVALSPSTSSHERKIMRRNDCGIPTTRQMATPGPDASRSTALPTSPATPQAGRRGRRRRHKDEYDGVSPVERFGNSFYRGFWVQTSVTTRTAAQNVRPALTPGPTPLRRDPHFELLRTKSATKS